ncbi:MAG: outer membrane beta-barrel protein [Deltaproteobacteria bacterium]|nr:outer membrane beta-barrel protein [Deltaproteobacteria bacterium]
MVLASDSSRFGIGIRGGFVFSGDDSITDATDGTMIDIDFDSSFMFGINTTYVMNDVLSMELSADYVLDRDMEFTMPGQSMKGGEVSTIPLLWTLRIHIPTNSGFKPYIGGGVGWYFNGFDQDPVWTASNPGVNLELFFTENVALNLDAKYIWSTADLKVIAPGSYQMYEIDLDGFVVGMGLKFYFQ